MFTRKEKQLLGVEYFTLIREDERFIEVESKCTGHCWMVFRKTYEAYKHIVLYHKHSMLDRWYHKHWRGWTVANAVANIKAHDKFVIDNLKYLEKSRWQY